MTHKSIYGGGWEFWVIIRTISGIIIITKVLYVKIQTIEMEDKYKILSCDEYAKIFN